MSLHKFAFVWAYFAPAPAPSILLLLSNFLIKSLTTTSMAVGQWLSELKRSTTALKPEKEAESLDHKMTMTFMMMMLLVSYDDDDDDGGMAC